jgi:hypothetical protein
VIRGTRRQVVVGLGALLVGGALSGCADDAEQRTSSATRTAAVGRVVPAVVSVRGGTAVTVHGSGLSHVTTVRVGASTIPVSSTGAGRIVFTAPASTDFASGRVAAVLLAGSSDVATAMLSYGPVDGVDRQLQYVLRYWHDYNPAYEAIPGDDCVDFTSQSLLERGWRQQDTWTRAEEVVDSGVAWRSSTAFMRFMADHPALGTELTDDQRSKVRPGDVVQFDWDGSGDRDHTGVVTRVTSVNGSPKVYFAGHTNDSDFRDVDDAITKDHPGGTAYYWSLT